MESIQGRFAFRVPPEIEIPIRVKADADYAGNISKLMTDWLRDRLVAEGLMEEASDSSFYHELEAAREALGEEGLIELLRTATKRSIVEVAQ
jgi:hypothetical protein